jgi:cysteine-rich repeat protein
MRYRIRSALITITAAMLLGSGPALAQSAACKADLTGDGVVNFGDLAMLKSVFFQRCNDPGPTCGDGVAQGPTEQCDDGNLLDGDGCSSTCTIEGPIVAVCGDGFADRPEQCDDGNLVNGDGCSSTCQIVPLPPFCGDGVVNGCGEECDTADLGGKTCGTQGAPGAGPLSCTPSCVLDTSTCQIPPRPSGCCQIVVGSKRACVDVSLVPIDECAVTNDVLAQYANQAIASTSATLAPADTGAVCDGASGLCAPRRSGPGVCCALSTPPHIPAIRDVCSEFANGSDCLLMPLLFDFPVTATPYTGDYCARAETQDGSVSYECISRNPRPGSAP